MSDEMPPMPTPQDGTITTDEMWAGRQARMQYYECPMCKAKNWHFHQTTFAVSHFGSARARPNVVPAHHDCFATVNDTAYRADCLSCGFIALFRVGFGP